MFNIFRALATILIFFFIRIKPAILLMGTLDCRLATKYIRSLEISSKTISSNSETPFVPGNRQNYARKVSFVYKTH